MSHARNEQQGRWLIAQGHVDKALVAAAYDLAAQRHDLDLCAVLVLQGRLLPSIAAEARGALSAAAAAGAPGDTGLEDSRREASPSPSAQPGQRDTRPDSDTSPGGDTRPDSDTRPDGSGRARRPRPDGARQDGARRVGDLSAKADDLRRALTSTRGSRSLAGTRMVAERYEVLAELARGGMGVVLKVRDQLKDGELCALKLMVADKARPTALKRFRREVEALTAVRHPSIVRVRDFGTEGGLPFYAMDYVPGEDLEVLTRERFRFADESSRAVEVCRRLAPIAGALAACHDQGLVHRDVKPANIVVADDDRSVLVDFGLAKGIALESSDDLDPALAGTLSMSGELLGTPATMSPEQLDPRGGLGEVGPPSDVWGLGATLFYALTGEHAFGGRGPSERLAAALNGLQRGPSAVCPDIPRALDRLCKDCLTAEPAKRPEMTDVAARLAAIAADPTGHSGARGPARGGRRGPMLVLLMLGIGGLGWLLVERLAPAEAPPVEIPGAIEDIVALRSGDAAVRLAAVRHLGSGAISSERSEEVRAALRGALLDRDALVRTAAAQVLGEMPGLDEVDVAALVARLSDGAVEMARASESALTGAAEPGLAWVAEDRHEVPPDARPAVARLIGLWSRDGKGTGSSGVLARLRRWISDEACQPEARREIAAVWLGLAGYESAEALVAKARRLASLGRIKEALAEAEVALALDPEEAGRLELLADLKRQRGDWAGALKLAREAAARAPRSPDIQSLLGRCERHVDGHGLEAFEALAKAWRLDSKRVSEAILAARCLTEVGRARESELFLEEVLSSPSGIRRRSALLVERARARMRLGKIVEGLRDLESLPGGTGREGLRLRGQLLVAAGGRLELLRALRARLTKTPADHISRRVYARLIFHFGDCRTALEETLRIPADQRDAGVLALIATCFIELGDKDRAKSVLESAIRRSPRSIELRLVRVSFAIQLSDKVSALKDLDAVLKQDQDHAEALEMRATLHFQAGRWREAARDGVIRLRHSPPPRLGFEGLVGRALLQQQKPGNAVPILRADCERRGATPSAWYSYGEALVTVGRYDDGITALTRALMLDPCGVPPLVLLADCYARRAERRAAGPEREGDLVESLRYFEIAFGLGYSDWTSLWSEAPAILRKDARFEALIKRFRSD